MSEQPRARGELCPPETTLLEFAAGALAPDAASEIEAHMDQCSMCRRAVAEIARSKDDATSSAEALRAPRDPDAGALFAGMRPIPLAPGEVVAERYRVDRLLAWGGMGVVYVATHLETEQHVALKVIATPVDAESRKTMEGFRLEARVFARIESEHVVRVLDAGLDERNQLAFIAMELLVGETLGRKVRTRGALSAAALLASLEQVAAALDAAHAHTSELGAQTPIVHRDLKPDNIFLTTGPDGAVRVKVLDFGIAKVASATTTESLEVRGTPQYMAPEQLEGARVGPATDVAALGLIAFFCLTGRSYWKAAGTRAPLAALVREILAGTTMLASERARELGVTSVVLPPAFDAWFARCTAHEPVARFPTAGEAVRALAAAFDLPTNPRWVAPRAASIPSRDHDARPLAALRLHAGDAERRRPRALWFRVGRVAVAIGALLLAVQEIGVRYLQRGSLAAVFQDGQTAGLGAYREGRSACHDGAFPRCVRYMERAIHLDPKLGPAYAWLAVLTALGGARVSDLTRSRLVVSAAVAHREGLAPEERAMVEGLGEMFDADPPEPRRLIRRLEAVLEEHPENEDLRVILARTLHVVGEVAEARRQAATVIATDIGHGAAYTVLAELALYSYDLDQRRRIVDACKAHVPRTISCSNNSTYLARATCDDVVTNARHVLALEPRHPFAFRRLVNTFVLQGRPESEAAAVVAEYLERSLPMTGAKMPLHAALAFEYGRFREADALAQRAAEENPTDAELAVEAMLIELAVAEETADAARIAEIARRPQVGRGSWSAEARRATVLTAAYRAGALDRREVDRERVELRARLPPLYGWHQPITGPEPTRFAVWVDVDASSVVTETDARSVADAFVDQHLAFMPMRDLDVLRAGAVWFRAGRYQEALAVLRSDLCDLLGAQVGAGVYVALLRAETLEAMGDAAGACKDYAAVLARWGRAERSATRDEARRRSEKLGCGR